MGAAVASLHGSRAAEHESLPAGLRGTVLLHRWLGATTAASASLAPVALERGHRSKDGGSVMLRTKFLFMDVPVLSITDHFGATSAQGFEHLDQ